MKGRGVIRKGHFADLVIFDEGRVIDRATYEEPRRFPEGIEYVIVNGQVLLERGSFNPIRPGKVLRRAE
jgi:N-acyl-D-amino-acid deacylase